MINLMLHRRIVFGVGNNLPPIAAGAAPSRLARFEHDDANALAGQMRRGRQIEIAPAHFRLSSTARSLSTSSSICDLEMISGGDSAMTSPVVRMRMPASNA